LSPEHARLFAGHNLVQNQRIYAAAASLGPDQASADRGAFFGSILGTLNHLAVGDTIWLHRFARHQAHFPALEAMGGFPVPTSLRHSLAQDLDGLRPYREALDGLILRWADELEASHMDTLLTYANMAGAVARRRFGDLLLHFFNHQTHHRGQVSTLLFQCGVDVGVTDLLQLIPDRPE
jgi:uncharacterized damage-inducible protein DinB